MKNDFRSAQTIARVGVLSALSAILYVIPGIPVIPPIYKLDFSSFPALIAGFAMGPMAAFLVTFVKNLTGLLHTGSMAIGQLADLIMGGTFAVVAAALYQRDRTFKGMLISLGIGTLALAVVGAAANAWIMIPVYSAAYGMPVEEIVGMIGSTIPAVDSLWKMIILAVVPFNLLKGVVLSVVSAIFYRLFQPLLEKKGTK